MSEETGGRRPSDPMAVWEQWYESVSRGMSRTMNGNGSNQAYPDPLGFYREWLSSVAEAQVRFKNSAGDPQELWKQWFETTVETWRKAAAPTKNTLETSNFPPVQILPVWPSSSSTLKIK